MERRGAIRNQDGIAYLNVRYLTKEDTGTFTISARNKSGMAKKEVKVVVHGLFMFTVTASIKIETKIFQMLQIHQATFSSEK